MFPAERQLVVPFDEIEVKALIDDALAECRFPVDHARYLVCEALRQRGLLSNPKKVSPNNDTHQPRRAA